jgi:hypothetical protein
MLNINPELYIGSNELRRAFQGIEQDGYQKLFSAFVQTYGVAYVSPTSLQAVLGSTGPRWITLKAGLAVDKNLKLIYTDIDVPNAIEFPDVVGTKYLSIRWKQRNTEKGVVSVATDGSVIGSGTEFTKVLRGAPLNQVKMRFPDSSGNLNDYEVLEVIDDTHAVLNTTTTLTPEIGKKYSVVGCFTPSVSIPHSNKLIYSYDDFELFFSSQLASDGLSFRLAELNWSGSVLTITDTRLNNKLTLFDTTAELVQQITQTVVAQYNLQVTQTFAAQIAVINSSISALQQADVNFASSLAALASQLSSKANSTQEAWKITGDSGQPNLTAGWTNSLGGTGRSKFMKTNMGTAHVHIYVEALASANFGAVIFTLPEGYRPTTAVMVPAARWTGTGFPSSVWCSIQTNGDVIFSEQAAFTIGHQIQFNTSFQTTL